MIPLHDDKHNREYLIIEYYTPPTMCPEWEDEQEWAQFFVVNFSEPTIVQVSTKEVRKMYNRGMIQGKQERIAVWIALKNNKRNEAESPVSIGREVR